MDYINTFYTREAYNEASSTLPKPSVSFIIETGEVVYKKDNTNI